MKLYNPKEQAEGDHFRIQEKERALIYF